MPIHMAMVSETVSFWRLLKQSEGQVRLFDFLSPNIEKTNLPGWCWAEIQ
jgi:hypothetical protein